MTSNKPRLCFIGFGEAGQAIASGLREAGVEQHRRLGHPVSASDEGATLKQAGETIGARLASSAADAVANSDIIVAAVTAASSLEAAQSVAPHICRQSVLSRHQFGLARPQAGDRAAARRHRALCRCRDPRADPSQAPPDAAAARRPARAGRDAAADRRTGDAGRDRVGRGRRRRGAEDDPQRDDQGHRGADRRMLPRRAARRHRRRGRGLAEEQLSDARLARR